MAWACAGDLYYLQVTTLEGATIFITSWTHGFYVNCCTETTFNPKPAPKSCSSHSLSGVLSQVGSSPFLRATAARLSFSHTAPVSPPR